MFEIFKSLLAKHSLSEAQIKSFANDFGFVVFMTLAGAAKDKLSSDEQTLIQQNWQAGKADEIFDLLQSKYSYEEWQNMLETNVAPLFSSYLREVVELGK